MNTQQQQVPQNKSTNGEGGSAETQFAAEIKKLEDTARQYQSEVG